MKLYEHSINGAAVAVSVATSVNKKGVFRYRETSGIGGNPEGVRGSEVHYKKLEKVCDDLSALVDSDWALKELVYIDGPRQYYGLLSDGEDEMVYQYITTYAPGSGQQYYFSPYMGSKRVIGTAFEPTLAGWIIKNRYHIQLEGINWHDRKNMIDLIAQGVTSDVMEAALVVMR